MYNLLLWHLIPVSREQGNHSLFHSEVRQHTGTCFAPNRMRWPEVAATGNPAMPARIVAHYMSGILHKVLSSYKESQVGVSRGE